MRFDVKCQRGVVAQEYWIFTKFLPNSKHLILLVIGRLGIPDSSQFLSPGITEE